MKVTGRFVLCAAALLPGIALRAQAASVLEPKVERRACASRGSSATAYDRQIVWHDKEHKRVMFVPEKLLNTHRLEDLPLEEEERNRIKRALDMPRLLEEREKQFGRKLTPCGQIYAPSPAGSSPDAMPLRDRVRSSDLAMIGHVEAVIPGWSVWESRVQGMVYFRVDEVLRDTAHQVSIGDVLTISQTGGSILVRGAKLCTESLPGFYAAKKGDRFLALGILYDHADPRSLEGAYVFHIDDGKILPQPYSNVTPFEAIPLDELLP
jgi:hypothetical protein